jgi:hypothetical protein
MDEWDRLLISDQIEMIRDMVYICVYFADLFRV